MLCFSVTKSESLILLRKCGEATNWRRWKARLKCILSQQNYVTGPVKVIYKIISLNWEFGKHGARIYMVID